ncbi:CFEM domain-containing protein [Seiridium cupressi]
MMFGRISLVAVALLFGFCHAKSLLDYADEIPACGIFFIDELFYTIVLALCRVSLLFFLIRVFSVPTFQKICWIVIGWVVVSAIIIILMTLFQCWPINYNWEGVFGDFGAHKCLDVNALAYAAAGMGIAQDFTILLLPLPIIAQLNMSFKKRLQTLFMFGLGIFVVLASCLRLRYLTQFAKSLNPTWDYTDPVIWTSLEVKVTIIVLSLPTIRVLLAKLIPSVFGTSQKSTPTKKFTPHSGSRSTGRNQYEDLPDGIASFEPARQLWEDDIELCGDIESSSTARLQKDDAQIGVVPYTLPKPEERSWS